MLQTRCQALSDESDDGRAGAGERGAGYRSVRPFPRGLGRAHNGGDRSILRTEPRHVPGNIKYRRQQENGRSRRVEPVLILVFSPVREVDLSMVSHRLHRKLPGRYLRW